MEPKLRVFELAKELNVDSKVVMEVLQTLNVDVKSHMSTVDQDAAEKVTKAVKRASRKDVSAEAAKAARTADAQKAAREANPAKASLLDDFFGASAKPRQRIDDIKRELRAPGERPLADRRPLAERRPLTERAPASERPASERPSAEVRSRPAVRPAAQRPAQAAARPPAARPAARPAAARTAPAERAPERVVEVPKAEPAPVEEVQVEVQEAPVLQPAPETPAVETPVPATEPPQEPAAEPVMEPVAEAEATERPESEGPTRTVPAGPAAGPRTGGPGLPRPAASGIGLPSRPVPAGPSAERTGLEGGPRRPAAGPSAIGMPSRPVPGGPAAAGPRPAIGLPRPGGGAGLPGPRPAGAGGPGLPRPGFGGPRPGGFRRGGPLTIPKVDPKVAEAAKPTENKPRIGQGGDRKKGDAFTKRETAASRPSEEKLFGRRPFGRSSVVERRSLKPITISGPMIVKDLAHEMGVTAGEVIKKLLTGFGIMATINQELDVDTCVLVAGEFGVEATVKEAINVIEEFDRVSDPDEAEELKQPRHPVVTIMGHVDHGKTSLLDAIRETRVAAGEAGGITQHIGAYEVELHGRKITFLDTPGHEAFTAMRARGANVTDVAVLVVAADDSVMPQTIESINHAKAANVPVLVAVNKIDKPDARPDKVKQDLTAHGLIAEEWGGETIMVPVSAKQRINLDLLLENILILADVLEMKANPNKEARGTILEAELDKARGPVATVLVQEGTLQNGDTFVAGTAWGRVRAMFDHRGRKLKNAGPSTPVRILGFNSVPSAGDVFRVTADEKTARDVADKRVAKVQAERQGTKAMSLDDFMSRVAEGEVKDLNLVIKADVQGSVEALRGQLEKLRNEEVQVKIVHSGVGAVTETDVMLALTSKAIIIGFNVRPDDRASRAASEQGVDIRSYDVIYNIVDDIKAAMTGMLAPKFQETILGRAEVREIFKVPKVGNAAGCMVVSGKVTRSAKYRLIRDGVVVWTGELNALRRFKEEVRDVAEGYECGITLEKFQDFKPGDILEAYEMTEIKAG